MLDLRGKIDFESWKTGMPEFLLFACPWQGLRFPCFRRKRLITLGKNKLAKFEENLGFKNLFQFPATILPWEAPLRGHWQEGYYGNSNPVVLEMGCGKGDYTVGLARRYPDKNFVGLDIKGARLWRGCKTATEESMANVAFVRTRAEFVERVFAPGEISEIWITFPDPQPSKPNKRLCSPMFLERYRKLFPGGRGIVHLKTDDGDLYEYCLHEVVEPAGYEILASTADLYAEETAQSEAAAVQTFYEKRWLAEGRKIKYLAFRLM